MVLSTATRRLRLQPSSMHVYFSLPRESLAGRVIEKTSSGVFDLNFNCTILNYVAQNIILILKIGYSIDEYHKYLDWFTFAAAMVSCIGTVDSLIRYKNRPPHKGRWFNFFVALVLVGLTGFCIAFDTDPRVFAVTVSQALLYVNKACSPRKETWHLLLGARRVPIAVLRIEEDVIIELRVSEEHAHLVDSLFQGGRNVEFSVYSGEGGMVEFKMKKE